LGYGPGRAAAARCRLMGCTSHPWAARVWRPVLVTWSWLSVREAARIVIRSSPQGSQSGLRRFDHRHDASLESGGQGGPCSHDCRQVRIGGIITAGDFASDCWQYCWCFQGGVGKCLRILLVMDPSTGLSIRWLRVRSPSTPRALEGPSDRDGPFSVAPAIVSDLTAVIPHIDSIRQG
jgi:hypothetical protein